jgi:hypothetical protein
MNQIFGRSRAASGIYETGSPEDQTIKEIKMKRVNYQEN